MPHNRSLVALAFVCLAAPAHADIVTQVFGAGQMSGDLTPYDIVGSQFDPALGTLTAVSAELRGTAVSALFRADGFSNTTRMATRYFLYTLPVTDPASPNSITGTLPDQTVTPLALPFGQFFTGRPTAFDQTFGFSGLSDFIGTSTSTTLLQWGVRASLPDLPTPVGGASDNTSFNGTLTLTYTFAPAVNVVEPATFGLLGIGALGVAAVRRRQQGS